MQITYKELDESAARIESIKGKRRLVKKTFLTHLQKLLKFGFDFRQIGIC